MNKLKLNDLNNAWGGENILKKNFFFLQWANSFFLVWKQLGLKPKTEGRIQRCTGLSFPPCSTYPMRQEHQSITQTAVVLAPL